LKKRSQLEPWRRAHARYIADLTDAEKILFKDATLENIFYSASAAQKLDEESNSFRAALKSLEPLCESISQYGRALDIYSSTKSQILGPIWGSIRVLIYVGFQM
jgi:hypothetical protein